LLLPLRTLLPFPPRRSSDLYSHAAHSYPGGPLSISPASKAAVWPNLVSAELPAIAPGEAQFELTATDGNPNGSNDDVVTAKAAPDRKSTRLNSSHLVISYAV